MQISTCHHIGRAVDVVQAIAVVLDVDPTPARELSSGDSSDASGGSSSDAGSSSDFSGGGGGDFGGGGASGDY